MKENRLYQYLSNNGRFNKAHPAYRRVFLLNIVLLSMTICCALFAVFNILLSCDPRIIYINATFALMAFITLIYLHKTDNLYISTYFAVGFLLIILLLLFEIAQNTSYALFWMVTLPPVAYFLLGTKKAGIVVGIFYVYMLYFMISKQSAWQPAEFNNESLINIAAATLGLIMMIAYFERSRTESADALLNANVVLEESKSELRLTLDTAAEGIYGIDPNGKCSFCNLRCLELLGYKKEEELIGKDMHALVHSRYKDGSKLPISKCRIHKVIVSGEKVYAEDEVFWRADGTYFEVQYYAYPKYKDNKIIGGVITFMDISERIKNEEKIQYLSYHDSLTGLINRQGFEMEIPKYNRSECLPLSILYGDLNCLKLSNDIFGHAAGDKLIIKAAQVLQSVCGRNGTVARIGGDEFILLLPCTDPQGAVQIMVQIKQNLLQDTSLVIKCSISMGSYTKYSLDEGMEQSLKKAENEMYLEKTSQRNSNEMVMLAELISALHGRSPREKTHSENISRLCEEMGIALEWPQSDIKNLRDAGFYHDIGKIVLNEELLCKTSKLSAMEKLEKQQHPIVGYRILNLFDNTLDLAEAVYYHHERWDGKGYPKGLEGEEIPIQSRIIAIAEQYDHLLNPTNDKALAKEEALLRIHQLAGVKFDPQLTDLFISIMKQS